MVKQRGKASADPLAAEPTESTSDNRKSIAGYLLPHWSRKEEKPPCGRQLRTLRNAVLLLTMETIWALHAALQFLILPFIVKTHRQGELPDPPFIFCVTHVGELDPYLVIRASGHYKTRAVFERDGPQAVVRFFMKAIWRFQVSQRPDLKPILNKKTIREVVTYLKRGGILMIFPEGYRHWEKELYPGVAVLAHRANVPVVPVGIEHSAIFRYELRDSTVRGMIKAIRDHRRLGYVRVHFTEPIHSDPNLEEREDVNRLMTLIEARFREFYKQFYDATGPVWEQESPTL